VYHLSPTNKGRPFVRHFLLLAAYSDPQLEMLRRLVLKTPNKSAPVQHSTAAGIIINP